MDTQDSVNLSWTDFQTNLSAFVSGVHNDEVFSDVTLVTEDNYQIKTNKLVLSASSLFFRKILTENPHQQPLIYLKGIAAKDLESIMAFIFNGEVRIKQDCVSSFMSISEDLQIKGFIEEFVGQSESIITVQETNIEVIKQEHNEDKDQVLASGSHKGNENKLDNIPDSWDSIQESNLDKKKFELERNSGRKEFENNIPKIVKRVDDRMPTEVNAEQLNFDDDGDNEELAEIPEFWEIGGLCNESLRQKLKSEKFNKCLVCDKLIGTDRKQLLKHWKFYHFENEVEHSVSLREGVELGKKKKKGEVPSMLKYQCHVCSSHPRGCDIPKHYSVKTNWELLAKMRLTGEALEEGADPHTLYMFEKGYTRKFGPTWRSHQLWKGEGK